jgi:hypothetical protein
MKNKPNTIQNRIRKAVRKLLCKVGIHNYEEFPLGNYGGYYIPYTRYICKSCKAEKCGHANFPDDLMF